ncbi:MAG: FAD-dependent oxidoreductase [Deltaproteobacteria bacterium]|nr:FAD-dependent oxidoreductase [Deltaproteobacteria bacterium]
MQPGDSVRIKELEIANRFVFAPIKTALAGTGGEPGDDSRRFYARIAGGGTALVTIEPAAVDTLGLEHPKQLRLHEDSRIEGIARLVDTIHQKGAKAMIHLNHAGRAANPKASGNEPIAPSAMVCPATNIQAREMSVDEIKKIPDLFASAARRAVSAGAEAIEIQFGHGYLLSQFFSERTNKRQDEWGGDERGRLRLPRLVVEGVRAETGSIPVLARISGKEFVEGGLEPGNLAPLLKMLENMGVAALHVGMGNACDSPPWYFHHMSLPRSAQEDVLSAIRKNTSLKIIAVGRLGNPDRIGMILEKGLADMVALGRPLLADPEFVSKLLQGREEEIAYCGACLQTCLAHVKKGKPIMCALNPWTILQPLKNGDGQKKVLVVGGGPAGMGAALGAAEQGHNVELVEQAVELGGQFALAVKAPGKAMMEAMVKSLRKRVAKESAVEVVTGTKADSDYIRKKNPDMVVLANGPAPRIPEIPGIDEQHLLTGIEYFENPNRVKGERVLVIGAGMVGMEAAEQLVNSGKEVVATKRGDEIAPDMDPISRALMKKRIAGNDRLQVMTGTTVLSFEKKSVKLKKGDDVIYLAPFDTVISAAGMEPDESLYNALNDEPFKVQLVGDAKQPGSIEKAFWDGLVTGRGI